jgi:hypothetical protein
VEGKGRDTQTCNIVWNMERDRSFWITSSEHQGTMPKEIFSFSLYIYIQTKTTTFSISEWLSPDTPTQIRPKWSIVCRRGHDCVSFVCLVRFLNFNLVNRPCKRGLPNLDRRLKLNIYKLTFPCVVLVCVARS